MFPGTFMKSLVSMRPALLIFRMKSSTFKDCLDVNAVRGIIMSTNAQLEDKLQVAHRRLNYEKSEHCKRVLQIHSSKDLVQQFREESGIDDSEKYEINLAIYDLYRAVCSANISQKCEIVECIKRCIDCQEKRDALLHAMDALNIIANAIDNNMTSDEQIENFMQLIFEMRDNMDNLPKLNTIVSNTRFEQSHGTCDGSETSV